jgi:hypothetical protein
MLLRETPPLDGQELRLPSESVIEAAVRIARCSMAAFCHGKDRWVPGGPTQGRVK